MANRTARGLPAPVLSVEFHSEQGSSLAEIRSQPYVTGGGYSYTAKTVVHYRSPADAGLQRWPALTLTAKQSQKLGITTEELQARYITKREQASPGFWQRYRLGYEPRTYTVVESETRTFPGRTAVQRAGAPLAPGGVFPSALQSQQASLLFGFGFFIPELHKTASFGFEDVEELELTFDLDFGIGLRLPTLAELASTEPMDEDPPTPGRARSRDRIGMGRSTPTCRSRLRTATRPTSPSR